jgi:hypothetical protein
MSEREDWDWTTEVLDLRKIRRLQCNGSWKMVPLSSSIWRNLLIKALTNIYWEEDDSLYDIFSSGLPTSETVTVHSTSHWAGKNHFLRCMLLGG